MQAEGDADETFTIARFTTRSFEDEFGSTIDGDLQLLQVAIIGIALYTYIAISNCRDGCVGSRLALTIGGSPSFWLPCSTPPVATRSYRCFCFLLPFVRFMTCCTCGVALAAASSAITVGKHGSSQLGVCAVQVC